MTLVSGERGTDILAENIPAILGGTASIIFVFILVVTIITVLSRRFRKKVSLMKMKLMGENCCTIHPNH